MALAHLHLSKSRLAWVYSAVLTLLFVLSMLAAWFLPMHPVHGLILRFTDASANSAWLWAEGLIWGVGGGWLIALVFGTIYNSIVARQALHSSDRKRT